MFVGGNGVGKRRYARALERALWDGRRQAYMLDGTNVLLGLDHDLAADAAQQELVRRFGEVANLLLRAGLIVVSTTNAIGLADHALVQALLGDQPSLAVDIDPSGTSTAQCDLRIRGDEPEEQVVARIAALLRGRGVLGL
jgi:bifunctional enzyme CysN/CysC